MQPVQVQQPISAGGAGLAAVLEQPERASAGDIITKLQKTAGNRAVQCLLARRQVQAKLTVGAANDAYEAEADRVAETVMRAAEPIPPSGVQGVGEDDLRRKAVAGRISTLQRKPEEEEELQRKPEEEEELQAKESAERDSRAAFEAGPAVEQELAAGKGRGVPLPGETRAFMEARFGVDFGGVRVHTGPEAGRLNRELSAQAFTHGADIYFDRGKYEPGTERGRRLLAHELTHVVQQTGGVRRQPALPLKRFPIAARRPPGLQRFSLRNLFRRNRGPKIVHGGGRKMDRGEAGNVPTAKDIELFYERSRQKQQNEGPGFWYEAPEEMERAMQSQREQETLAGLGEHGYTTDMSPAPYTGPTLPANVPLTGADLKAARQLIYQAALQTLDSLPQDDDPARAQRIQALRAALVRESTAAAIRDEESLLARIAAGDKELLKQVISKDLLDRLAVRIAEAAGQEVDSVEQRAHVALVQIINASERWAPFAKELDLPGGAYTSQFTPINEAFDPTFAGYGASGYASMSAHLPVSEQAPPEQRTRATNAWYTQFRRGDTVSGDILFEAFRSGSFSEKGVKDPEQRAQIARAKAYDLLKAMAVQYLKSREPGDQQAILEGTQIPTITVVSTALLTSFFGKLDHKLLKAHAEAFESFHDKVTTFDIMFGEEPKSISVKFNVINFNKAVNEFRWFGASRSSQQLKMNKEAIKRLRAFKEEGLGLLEEKYANNQGKLDGLIDMGEGENAEALRQQNEALAVRIAKIKQLWARIETVTARRGRLFSGSGSGYELPALASNLAYQLGAMVHYNCMSGKDRTGMADVEAKLLAYQMDQRVKEAQESGVSLDQVNLVPKYNKFTEGDAQAAATLMFESGNLDIQQINTGVAGYKVRGAMAGLVSGGRLGKILSTEGGQSALRKYLGVDEQISLKAKTFTKAVNALSFLTGA